MIKFLQKIFSKPVEELRWENKDDQNQVIEYNQYINGVKQGGVNVHYFTSEQIAEIERIQRTL